MQRLPAAGCIVRFAGLAALYPVLTCSTSGTVRAFRTALPSAVRRVRIAAIRVLLPLLACALLHAAGGDLARGGGLPGSETLAGYARSYAPPEGYPAWVEVPVLTPEQIDALVPTIVVSPATPNYGSIITNAPAGSVIALENGTYTLTSTIYLPINGTAGAPVTIIARNKGQAVIDAANVREAFNPYGNAQRVVNYLRMVGLKIINGQRSGLYMQYGASHHFTIQDCEIASTGVPTLYGGIYVAAGDCLLVSGCNIHDNGDGIRLGIKDASFMAHVLIENTALDNNDIGSSNSDGVGVENALSSDIYIRDVKASNHVDSGFDLKPRTTLVRCISHNNSIGVKAWRSAAIANCLTYGNSYTAVNAAGLDNAAVLIEGCTFAESNWAMVISSAPPLNSLAIRNCIIGGTRNNLGGALTTDLRRNVFVPPLPVVGSASLSSDPQFVSAPAGDYHIRGGSPALSIGGDRDSLPAMEYDLDLALRAAPYGAGAYNMAKGTLPPIGAPTWLTATNAAPGISLRWVAPSNAGGYAIRDYLIEYKASSDATWVVWPHLASPGTSAVITGLTYGASYDFRVSAVTTAGTGLHSLTASALSCTKPDAPTIGTAALTGVTGQARVTFVAPGFDGGTPITSYTVTSTPGAISVAGATSPITVPGLTNGTAYSFTVRATNAEGDSSESRPSNAVTPVATVPDAPTMLRATPDNQRAVVTFIPPVNNGGEPITSYAAVATPGGQSAAGPGSPLTVSGLTNGVSYTFSVHATNAVGASAESATSNACTPAPSPSAPTEGLIANYHLDEAGPTVTDSSGHAKHGTAHGTTVVPGRIGNGYAFDGIGDYVALAPGGDPYFHRTSMTIALWFKQRDSVAGVLFADGRPGSNYEAQINTYQLLSGGSGVRFDWRNNPTRYEQLLTSAVPATSDGNWHQAIVSWHPLGVNLYVDGVLAKSYPTPPSGGYNTRVTAIGARDYVGAMEGFFAGTIDEVKVWDWAFSAPDAMRLYQAETPPTAPTGVAVSPTTPGTLADLTAVATGSTNPNPGDAVSYQYQWCKSTDNGATFGPWGNAGAVLPHALTAKGEVWKAQARAGTPVLCSGWRQSAPVTIADTAPTVPTSVSISPASPQTDDDLAAAADGSTDADGTTLTYSYEWAKSADGGATWGAWANGGSTLPKALTTNGEQWKSRGRAFDGEEYGPWLESAAVTVGKTTLPAPATTLVIPTKAYTNTDLTAISSGCADPGTGTLSYTYEWAKSTDGGVTWGPWDVTGPKLDRSLTTRGEMWKARGRAFDGDAHGPWLESSVITILNTRPTAPTVTVSPLHPHATNGLKAVTTGGSDADGDRLTYPSQWSKSTDGGTTWSAWTWRARIVSNSLTTRDEQWRVRARSSDGTATSAWVVSAPVQIENSAPSAPEDLTIAPEAPGPSQALVATATGSVDVDPDDAVAYRYQWRSRIAEGKTWTAWYYHPRTVPPAETSRGKQWQVRARATDGTLLSGWKYGPVVTIDSATTVAAAPASMTVAAFATNGGVVAISVTLSRASAVQVRILNLAGREVAVLPRRSLEAGTQSLLWNGRSTHGTRAPAGQYLVRVEARQADGGLRCAMAPLQR